MNVIPLPNYFKEKDGFFTINSETKIRYSNELEPTAKLFINFIKEETRYSIEKDNYASINFLLDFELEMEQYQIEITKETITLRARCDHGAFYGFQTLKQLLCYQNRKPAFPCLDIDDKPRFSYRGFMLDVARHFFDKTTVKRLIDILSFHKFNTLHLHLTDDQGWRIESNKYPLLNEIGSKRKGTILKNKLSDNEPHEGYYTKVDLKEIVAYAKSKHIEVIPEIDMPGHMNALIASYPNTLCSDESVEVRETFGISKHILCAGNNEVYKMLEDIILEINDIFESKYFHIGGDEVPKDNWKNCEKCQEKIKENNLKDEEELQAYFFNYFSNFLREHGKTTIGWNDAINEKLASNVIIQHWKPFSNKKTVKEINDGRRVIISNFFYLYLDYPYSLTPLQKTYNFNPILRGVKEDENILGIEAPLWTEWVKNERKIDFQIFPRLAAVAEVGWTNKENKSYSDFASRLKEFLKFYDKFGINYAHNVIKKHNLIKRVFQTIAWVKNENIEYDKN